MSDPSKLTISILQDLLPKKISKSDRRKLEILNGAIETYAQIGIEYISYEDIARAAKTSSALVQHYFPDKDEFFDIAMKLVRGQFQQMVIDIMSKKKTPHAMMEAYVRATFCWLKDNPVHPKVWLFFLYICGTNEKRRKLHAELTAVGQSRIIELINLGVKAQIFHPKLPLPMLAKHIQKIITGGLIEVVSEVGLGDINRIEKETWELCLTLLK